MLTGIIIFAAGVFCGWNFFPQPEWIKALYGRWFGG
jgi:hypothetical protein